MDQYGPSGLGADRESAVTAAVEVGVDAGYPSTSPVVLQDSNNVVVWLAPHEVVAKVGIWPHSADALDLEVQVCTHLAAGGAPVAAPIGGLRHGITTAWPVSLWERLSSAPGAEASDAALAGMLHEVHSVLAGCPVDLPNYLVAIEHARTTLFDDDRMAALPNDDLQALRGALDELTRRARAWDAPRRPLHGEPHLNNVVLTPAGPMLIDFEAASTGPVEWDLASMPPGVATRYGEGDAELLTLLRVLNSARVATWGWALAEHPSMREHGERHLAVVRHAFG